MKNEVVEMILFIFISFNTANIVKCRAFVNRKRRFLKDIFNFMLNNKIEIFKEYVNENFTKLNRFTDVTNSSMWYFYDVAEAANEHIGITHSDGETWSK
jgi:hypothetical protein